MHIYLLIYEITVAGNQLTGEVFIFQQDSAPAHRAQDTVALLAHKTPRFIGPDLWPPNSPDLNPVNYKIWGYFQEQVSHKSPIVDVTDLKQRLLEVWSTMKQRVMTRQRTNGKNACTAVCQLKADTLNTSCDIV